MHILKEIFKEQLRSYRELLWSMRLFFAGFVSSKVYDEIDSYIEGEIGLTNLILIIVFGIIFLLIPFAYGIDPLEEDDSDEEI